VRPVGHGHWLRHRTQPALGELLAAHDGPCLIVAVGRGMHSSQVLPTSTDLAARLRAQLHVIHVVDEADYPVDPDGPGWEERAAEELQRRERGVRDELVSFAQPWSYHAVHGHPGAVLRDLGNVHQPLMLIVGAGAGGVGGLLERAAFGFPSSSLLHHSDRPVLVVPRAAK